MFDIDSQPEFIVEESLDESTGVKNKKYKIQGIFSTIGEKNRNGRIYPRNLWETEVGKYQNNFDSGSINTLMEWEHPSRTQVDPMEAVSKITKLYIKDKYVMGEAVLLDNPKANQLKSLIDNGVKISVSSRGVGSIKNGVVENFKLVTYDIVAAPSDYNATMNGLVESHQLNEGVIEDLNFEVNENGTISQVKVCDKEEGTCHMFETEDVQKAITDKFGEILKSLSESKKTLNESKLTIELDGMNVNVKSEVIDDPIVGQTITMGKYKCYMETGEDYEALKVKGDAGTILNFIIQQFYMDGTVKSK